MVITYLLSLLRIFFLRAGFLLIFFLALTSLTFTSFVGGGNVFLWKKLKKFFVVCNFIFLSRHHLIRPNSNLLNDFSYYVH
jgi:hypothetical protein